MGVWNRRKKYSLEKEETTRRVPRKFFGKLVRRQFYVTTFSIVAVTLVILGSTYAIFSSVNKSKDYNEINVGTLSIQYEDTGDGLGGILKLNSAFPVSDEEGMRGDSYKFKITNTGTVGARYTVRIADDQAMIDADNCSENLLPKEVLKYSLNGESATFLNTKEKGVINDGYLSSGDSRNYDLRMWISNTAGNEILGKHFHGKIVVELISDEPDPTPEACFDFDNKTGTITRYQCWKGGTSSQVITDVVIPKTIGGVPVTRIGYPSDEQDEFSYNYAFSTQGDGMGLTSIVIPEGIKIIGVAAFYGNSDIQKIKIPNSVTEIGGNAFGGIEQLRELDLGTGVQKIEFSAFQGGYPSGTPYLTNLVLPSSLVEIGDYAFRGFNLNEITIPSSVMSIGEGAFSGNYFSGSKMTNVIIKGKKQISDFTKYNNPFGPLFEYDTYVGSWLENSECYNYANLHKDDSDWGDNDNSCIHWELKS